MMHPYLHTEIKMFLLFFSFLCMNYMLLHKTLELTDWQVQKVCPSKVLTDFSIGLYPQQKLLSFSHYLRLKNANRPKAATIAAPAATARPAETHASELAYSKLLKLDSVP